MCVCGGGGGGYGAIYTQFFHTLLVWHVKNLFLITPSVLLRLIRRDGLT